MRKAPSRKTLIRTLDTAFSKYIRKHYADFGGWVTCVTCETRVPWTECHAGHFVRRGHHLVRWDERNVHPQCVHCNTYLDGNEGNYARFILDRYGREVLDELLAAKKIAKTWRVAELKELIERYRERT